MASLQGGLSKPILRLAAVMLAGVAASACSTVPSWVDPTTWIGPDAPDQADTTDNGAYPDLANMPAAPAPASTGDERKQVADSLIAARNNTQYSAETLRGGTEAAAAPPPAAPPPQQVARAEAPVAKSEPAAEPEPAANPDEEASAAAPTDEVASAEEPSAGAPSPAEPVAPAAPASSSPPASSSNVVPPVAMSDSALGFQPSKAPPLDASVAQFVAPQIIARFAQTAAVAPAAAVGGEVALKAPRGASPASVGVGESDVGGPESMSGAVVANLGVLQPAGITQASVYANAAGLPPAAVVFFPGDITSLNAGARREIRSAVAAFRNHGGQGYIRVVGHSSSRTANMPVLRHIELNYKKSLRRATAVAHELIREGVPADKVLVNAVGDSEPVYYESMPKGEDGNRRAEIFFQG